MIRQAIARSLADMEGFEIVGQASTAEEAVELVARSAPDVVLMDIGMPVMGGLQATETICKSFPQVSVLILTIHDREDYFFKALQSGASGYILKGAEMEDLVEAIKTVAQGSTYIYPSLMPRLVADYLQRVRTGAVKPGEPGELTAREQEVLRLIAEGRTTNEIAEALTLSPHTVRRHRDHIMDKLNLHSKAELIRFAIRVGLLDAST
ncbi:MAG: response regulator transcription factor [Chloroflexi bacterium]|nr:response regulator transcription factor [Chloroflexota bacterium]